VYMVYCKGHMSFDCAACPFMEKKHVRGGGASSLRVTGPESFVISYTQCIQNFVRSE
jgi:hypothetical protein